MRTLYPHRAETPTRVARLPRMQPEGGQSGLRRPAVAVLAVLALVAVIVALAAVFGLGPFDDGGASATTLSKAQFTAKGDQVCKAAHDKFVELQKTPPNSAEGAATLTQNLIEISENELSQIRALDVPPRGPAGARPSTCRPASRASPSSRRGSRRRRTRTREPTPTPRPRSRPVRCSG